MAYFEYEHILEEIKVIQKEQEKQNEEHEKAMGNYNPTSFQRSMQNSMNNYKIPTPRMPQMQIPKF